MHPPRRTKKEDKKKKEYGRGMRQTCKDRKYTANPARDLERDKAVTHELPHHRRVT
jgi:hypothetical protein